MQLFLLLDLSILSSRNGCNLFIILAVHITQVSTQSCLLGTFGLHAGVILGIILKRALETSQPTLALDLHTPNRTYRVGYILRSLEQRHLLVLQRIGHSLRLGYLLGNIIPHKADISLRHGRSVTTRNHRHIDRGQARCGKDKTLARDVAVVAIDHKAQQRTALAHLHTQLAAIGDVCAGAVDKAVATYALLDGIEVNLADGGTNDGYLATLNPSLNGVAGNQHLVTQAVENSDIQAMHRSVGTMMACAAIEEDNKGHDKYPQQGYQYYFKRFLHYAFFSNSAAIASQ